MYLKGFHRIEFEHGFLIKDAINDPYKDDFLWFGQNFIRNTYGKVTMYSWNHSKEPLFNKQKFLETFNRIYNI